MARVPSLLLVDDDPVLRAMLAGLLATQGLEVVEAGDGLQALSLALRRPPDLVLLDIGLPGLDGFSVCARIRGVKDLAEIPILMLTGRDDADSIRQAFEAGATDFVSKATSPELIAHRVKFMLRAASVVAELRRSEVRLAEAQRIARVGNWELDLRSGAFLGSAETFRLFGFGSEAGVCPLSRVRGVFGDEDRATFDRSLHEATRRGTGRFDCELRLALPGGATRVMRLIGEVEPGASREGDRVLGTAQDLTELVESREQIRTLAYYDALTGLPNRLLFVDQLRGALALARRRGRRLALMVVDLDNFKRINDTLGHGAGDEVLRVVGGRLREMVREYDAITRPDGSVAPGAVARMGGDEFLLSVLDLEAPEQAATVARRLLEAVSQPIQLGDGPLYVSASVGIAISPEDGEEFEALLKHADTALYHAKDAGRSTYEFFDRRMNEAALQRLVLEASLRAAISERQLTVAIQPKVDARTREVIGGEALLRWRHRDHGNIAPSIFVGLAERNGLAVPLTRLIVEDVSRQLRAWQDAGLVLKPLAINLSPHVLRDAEAVEAICAIPVEAGVAPSLIEYEVTETVLIDDPTGADAVLARLRTAGYRVALDDFGTGYSSLSHLRNFRLDALKIDRSFVRDLHANPRDAAIVRGMVGLAQALGLQPVAEGVESEAQRAILLDLGCTVMQGYLFGEPAPMVEFARHLLPATRT